MVGVSGHRMRDRLPAPSLRSLIDRMNEVTRILNDIEKGDAQAPGRLLSILYHSR